MTRKDVYLQRVLAECNRVRGMLKLPPRDRVWPGYRRSRNMCPVARTISRVWIDGLGIYRLRDVAAGKWEEPLDRSPVLVRFAKRFDAGEFSELDLRRGEVLRRWVAERKKQVKVERKTK